MNDVLNFGKKLFTFSVVAMTIVWSIGLSALVPTTAYAAECSTLEVGDLFKVPGNTAVYMVSEDMGRRYFPTSDVYMSWFADFSGVQEISESCGMQYSSDGPVLYRAGSALVKNTVFSAVYAVLPSGEISHITSGDVAAELYGENWGSVLVDVPDFLLDLYTTTDALEVAVPHNGQFVKADASADTYYVSEGKFHKVDGELSSVTSADVRTVSAVVFDSVEMSGTTITESAILAEVVEKPASTPADDTSDDVASGGDVTVSLSANTPASGNVVVNIDNVVFTKVILRAGSADAVVNSVKIGRTGLGATGDFDSVTLYDGNTKLGSTRTSWHSDGYMIYNISGGWNIPANTPKELTIVAKLGTGKTGTYNALGVLDLGLGSGNVMGTPVYGNQMSGVAVTVGTVTIDNAGAAATKKIGSTDVDLAKFKLTMSSVEDAELTAITLKNKAVSATNASDGDLANVSLYKGSTKLAGPVSMVSDKINFVLDDPYLIEKSKNETFTVKGDIVNGDANTVEFVLDDPTDLKMTGKTYNTQVSVTESAFDDAGEGDIITIDGAELNLALTGVALETGDDVTDVEFGRITLSSGSTDVKITSFVVTVDETDGSDTGSNVVDVDELELVDAVSGAAYSGTMTNGGDEDADDETWTYTDEIYLTAGESIELVVRGDIPASTSLAFDDSWKLSINTANITAETVPAGDSVSNFSVGTVTGKLITLRRPTMTIKSDPLNTANAVVNDENVVLFSGTLKATAGDIRFERMLFNSSTALGLAAANWTDLGLYFVDSVGEYTLQKNVTNSSLTNGSVDFDSLDFTIPSGVTQKFAVKGTLAGTNSSTASVVQIELDTVTAKDADSDDATVQDSAGTAIANGAELTTTRVVTITSKGILYVQMRNADAGFNKDRVLLAGNSAWVGKLRMRADYEDVLVKDLKLTNTNAASNDSLASVCLYKAQSAVAENLIGCTTVDSSAIAFFDDINETVTQGTQDWYIYVTSNNMGNAAAATADSQDLAQFGIVTTTGHLTAQGVASGDEFAYHTSSSDATVAAGEIVFDQDLDGIFAESGDTRGTASTTAFYIAGSKISNVQLVSSYGGAEVASSITGTGSTTVAILAVTTEAHSNTDANGNPLRLAIDNFVFDMNKYVSTTMNGATVERIGGTVGPKNLAFTASTTDTDDNDVSDDWTMATVTTTLGADAFIDAGETAYFKVVANINALTATSNLTNWVQVGLDDVKGGSADGNNNIDWFDGYDTTWTTGNNYDYLFLDTTSITGAKISAPTNN